VHNVKDPNSKRSLKETKLLII